MMTTANDLIVVFLALEILSIPLYVLAAFDRRRLSSQEAGIKYFVLGAFSSAIFLYGIALVYGATGSTSLTGILDVPVEATRCSSRARCVAGLDAAARRARLQGRGGAVPHVDARRVPGRADAGHRVHGVGHQGRRLRRAAARVRHRVPAVPRRLAAGGVGARRAHAGRRQHRRRAPDRPQAAARVLVDRARRATCCMAFQAATPKGIEAALFYLFVYTFMVVGSFAVVTVLTLHGDADHSIDGLPRARRAPSGARVAAGAVHAGAGRHPAHRRVRRQARGVRRRRRRAASTCSS